ncbi:hypothetical protein E2C01_093045 [Portunus trituberculatus]|uniref:Uncharacterized protein n=1 Tax=Portunus trituberculatus TaxID=210409 RepID=A0A5B7JXK9_PORTR|nr:hypothetical protein [Portunus trituberculatus]
MAKTEEDPWRLMTWSSFLLRKQRNPIKPGSSAPINRRRDLLRSVYGALKIDGWRRGGSRVALVVVVVVVVVMVVLVVVVAVGLEHGR